MSKDDQRRHYDADGPLNRDSWDSRNLDREEARGRESWSGSKTGYGGYDGEYGGYGGYSHGGGQASYGTGAGQAGQAGGFERGTDYGGIPGDYQSSQLQRRYGPPPTMPKGYTRSDERIREDVCEHLSRSGLDVREVSVDVAAGHVTLQGTVHDRHAKHAIENCADECIGVQDIDNRIRVQR